MKIDTIALAIAACITTSLIAEPTDGLDGVSGHIYKMDLAGKRFELLKETVFDPKTDIGKSRFTVYWTDQTTISKIEERKNFAGIKGPVATKFHGMNQANSTALTEGEPFVARVATVLVGAKKVTGINADHNSILSWFTPDASPEPRAGVIQVKDKLVKVSLRERNSRLYVHLPVTPSDIAKGFWKTTIHGKQVDGKFVVEHMDVSSLPDPRTTDDPNLPRVLVVGDSISMNYHESAKSALKGIANYHRNEGNCFSTAHGVRSMELWLGDYKEKGLGWDVIQFNHGLHDLKQVYDKTNDVWGAYAMPLEQYKENLEKEIQIMKQTGAQLIWCATTPVPNDNKGQYGRRKGAATLFNAAAMEVMQKHPEIMINDLYKIIDDSPVFDKWRKGNDVHFWGEEQTILGDAVAHTIKMALKQKK